MQFGWRKIVLLLAMLALTGCNTVLHKGRSPLAHAQMSPDSVGLDMFSVRFPIDDAAANDVLWQEIDEQSISPELRERLARNGFRAGVVTGAMPIELSKLLGLGEKTEVGRDIEDATVDVSKPESGIRRRHLQLRAGQRSEVIASGEYAQLTVLPVESGELRGQTYNQAQGIFALKSFPQPDGRVRLEFVPEVHHGQPGQRFVGDHGVFRLDVGRPKREFAELAVSADLTPGAMIVLGCLPSRPGSLGHQFFTENEGGRLEQKLLIVRLSQTQQDGLFNPPEPLDLAFQGQEK